MFRYIQIVIITNFVILSSVGIKRVDCIIIIIMMMMMIMMMKSLSNVREHNSYLQKLSPFENWLEKLQVYQFSIVFLPEI